MFYLTDCSKVTMMKIFMKHQPGVNVEFPEELFPTEYLSQFSGFSLPNHIASLGLHTFCTYTIGTLYHMSTKVFKLTNIAGVEHTGLKWCGGWFARGEFHYHGIAQMHNNMVSAFASRSVLEKCIPSISNFASKYNCLFSKAHFDETM